MPSTSSLPTCLSYHVNDLIEQERGKADILCMTFSVRGWGSFTQPSLASHLASGTPLQRVCVLPFSGLGLHRSYRCKPTGLHCWAVPVSQRALFPARSDLSGSIPKDVFWLVFFHGPARSLTSGDALGLVFLMCLTLKRCSLSKLPCVAGAAARRVSPGAGLSCRRCREVAARSRSSAATRGPRVPSADGGDGARQPGQPRFAPGWGGKMLAGLGARGGLPLPLGYRLGMGLFLPLPDPTSQPWCVPARTVPHVFLLLARDLKYCKSLSPTAAVLPKELRVWFLLVLGGSNF